MSAAVIHSCGWDVPEEEEIVYVTGVTLNKTSISLDVKGKETLTATVAPNEAMVKIVQWSSSDKDVATVSQTGEVTGVAEGTAAIKVTTFDGSKTATCDVTVSEPFVAVTDITDVPTTAIAGTPLTLTGTVVPQTATNQNIMWSVQSGGNTGATISGNSNNKLNT